MRKYCFFFALFLAGCQSSGDDGFTFTGTDPPPLAHPPELTSVALLLNTAVYMQGNGSVVATVEITFRDAGMDLRALRVRMPDDSIIEFAQSLSTVSGTFSEELTLSTQTVGTVSLEFWLLDEAGNSSDHLTSEFSVVADMQSGDWTNRLGGLPNPLGDVIWDGDAFIAVGSGGTVLTSADGITWVAIESGIVADLSAISFYESDIYTVGDAAILHSADHGASWTLKASITEAVLQAVAVNESQVVVGGYRWNSGTAITLVSEDRGDTWQAVDSWPNENVYMNDLVYRDGLFVASTPGYQAFEAWVTVSSDGKVWNEIAASDEGQLAVPHTIIHDGSQFILAGLNGAVFTSFDGFNWTGLQTPVRDVAYTSAAAGGSKLVLAGASPCGDLWFCSEDDAPLGLSSTDGGTTWELFNIDGDFESSGLAWGHGRFVTVGENPRLDGEGAIYTSD